MEPKTKTKAPKIYRDKKTKRRYFRFGGKRIFIDNDMTKKEVLSYYNYLVKLLEKKKKEKEKKKKAKQKQRQKQKQTQKTVVNVSNPAYRPAEDNSFLKETLQRYQLYFPDLNTLAALHNKTNGNILGPLEKPKRPRLSVSIPNTPSVQSTPMASSGSFSNMFGSYPTDQADQTYDMSYTLAQKISQSPQQQKAQQDAIASALAAQAAQAQKPALQLAQEELAREQALEKAKQESEAYKQQQHKQLLAQQQVVGSDMPKPVALKPSLSQQQRLAASIPLPEDEEPVQQVVEQTIPLPEEEPPQEQQYSVDEWLTQDLRTYLLKNEQYNQRFDNTHKGTKLNKANKGVMASFIKKEGIVLPAPPRLNKKNLPKLSKPEDIQKQYKAKHGVGEDPISVGSLLSGDTIPTQTTQTSPKVSEDRAKMIRMKEREIAGLEHQYKANLQAFNKLTPEQLATNEVYQGNRKGLARAQAELQQLMSGSGKSNDNGIYGDQITQIMKVHKQFIGVVASDELKTLLPYVHGRAPIAFIINLDKHTQAGSHWVACYIDPVKTKSVEYFDSYGDSPKLDILKGLKDIVAKMNPPYFLKMKINRVVHQNKISANCGYFAMLFLIERMRGKTFAQASGYDDTMLRINKSKKYEAQIEKLKQQPPFSYINHKE